MCGLPSSGKTYIANALKDYLEENYKCDTIIVNDSMFCHDKNSVYMGKTWTCKLR